MLIKHLRIFIENCLNYVGFYLGKCFYYPLLVGRVLYASYNSGFISSAFLKRPLKSFRIGSGCHIRGAKYISIQEGVTVGNNVILTAWDHFREQQKFTPHIRIGANCHIGDYCNISAINSIIIGKNVLFGRYITIIDHSHGTNLNIKKAPWDRDLESKGGGINR